MGNFVGKRTRSKEGPRHVTGRGLYTDDFQLPGMLQALILRSPHAHAKILSVDASEALQQPNVFAVVTLTACWRPTPSCAVKSFPLRQSVAASPQPITSKLSENRRA